MALKDSDIFVTFLLREESDILFRLLKERIIRESDFDNIKEIFEFRKKAKPLINKGYLYRKEEINHENPPEIEYHYYLTRLGKEYSDLHPAH